MPEDLLSLSLPGREQHHPLGQLRQRREKAQMQKFLMKGSGYPKRRRKVAISMGSRWTVVLLGEAVASGYISVKEEGCREIRSRP